ncbi:MAG: Gfo/Idh/MocA family protein, partial [Planctomycetota bacterium]
MQRGEPLGLGLIGCGDFGRFCLAAFAEMEDVRIAAVADIVPAAAESAGRDFDVPFFTDPKDLIAHPDVHIVHLATPPSTHHGLALAAIGEGRHVLCEKPLALTVEDADEIVVAAADAHVVCPVDFVLRYNDVVDTVKAVLDSGVLGEPLAARLTNCAGDSKLPAAHWFWDKAVSGGIFVEHG